MLLTAAGAHAARVPLVETDLLAGWLAARRRHPAAGRPADRGASPTCTCPATGWPAQLHRVPWARAAAGLVVLTPAHVVLLAPDALRITDGTNLAEEPRDTVQVGTAVPRRPRGWR